MTATQVFLRFIEERYKNEDGTIKAPMAKLWRDELRHNGISSKLKYPYSYDWRKRSLRAISSKNYVDDFLTKNKCTLQGFIGHFLKRRTQWGLAYRYGSTQVLGMQRIGQLWREFLKKHIVEEEFLKKYWREDRQFTFTWKE